jgi:heme exporter protein C
VLGVVGFVDVPITHESVVWWRSLHQGPTVLQLGSPTIAPVMLAVLMFSLLAFTLAYGYLMAVRMRVGRLEDRAASTVVSVPAPRARAPRPTATPVATVAGGEGGDHA